MKKMDVSKSKFFTKAHTKKDHLAIKNYLYNTGSNEGGKENHGLITQVWNNVRLKRIKEMQNENEIM